MPGSDFSGGETEWILSEVGDVKFDREETVSEQGEAFLFSLGQIICSSVVLDGGTHTVPGWVKEKCFFTIFFCSFRTRELDCLHIYIIQTLKLTSLQQGCDGCC